ncbi:hypothetical protein Glove_194g145 [Diversispora epigaea]|uniref:Aconitase/3-isopropylmalate dehydratase large subunit alpha/beta/alpha domain-containing protein n=1 Tax=Diversispora epigaea TaxID=1348612 RepID=A0A397IUS3_9GLOM|nr:hypothetical protein Glove_194g145 [Diversispora epigaea]
MDIAGLGAADVVMPLVTGETWFKVLETVEIKFVGKLHFSIGGKDTMLHVLEELKRNTVAFERAVEYTGPGLKYLLCDARFAISNMTTEFGDIADVFEVDSLVALYPSADDIFPAKNVEGKKLDGVFIGICTTAEEDLILADLVLEQGLKKGYRPSIGGKRCVTPGSLPVIVKLHRLGLVKFYEQAGFEIRTPGCSYEGAIGNLESTATVAASSIEMKIKDPKELIDLIDPEKYKEFLEQWFRSSTTGSITAKVQVFEDNVGWK